MIQVKTNVKKLILRHFYIILIVIGYYGLIKLLKTNCLFRFITSIPCPTCGTTRSFISLITLDFSKSFYYHPIGFLIVFTVFMAIHKDSLFKLMNKLAFWICFYFNILIIVAVYMIRLSFGIIP